MKTTLYFLLFILGAGVAVAQDNPSTTEVDITKSEKIKLDGKQPLFVIDNEAIDPKTRFDIDLEPEDIKEITVIKPPSSTDQYGEKLGKRGIVVITTKNGEAFKAYKGNLISESYTKPVYYINGERVGQIDLKDSDLNPDDIASITVLKGFDKIPEYGEEALGGIILITTKS